MITTDLTTLKINKLTKAQYEAALAAGTINENELYMTPESEAESGDDYATKSDLNTHVNDTTLHTTADEKTKLAGIETNANNYTHPSSHPANMITEDSMHRFVTDSEKAAWNEKEIFTIHVTGTAGILSSDKNIEDIIEAYNSGKKCIAIYNGAQYNLTNNPENDGIVPYARFMAVLNNTLSSITVGKIGLSAEFGWEDGSNITYNTLPSVSSTDSGKVLMVNESGSWAATSIPKPTITAITLLASSWDSTAKTYSFETTYPNANYDIEIALNSTATTAQAEAFNGAQIVGSATSNIIKAYGDVPTVDIPVILKVVKK